MARGVQAGAAEAEGGVYTQTFFSTQPGLVHVDGNTQTSLPGCLRKLGLGGGAAAGLAVWSLQMDG